MEGFRHISSFGLENPAVSDFDGFMDRMNNLMKQSEQVKNNVKSKINEVNTLVQALQSDTLEDIQSVFNEFLDASVLTADEKKMVQDYQAIKKDMHAYTYCGTSDSCFLEGGDILLQFKHPSIVNSDSKLTIWLTTTKDKSYTVKLHDLPKTIPVEALEKEYLFNKSGAEEFLHMFVTAIDQYTWPYFNRLHQISQYETSELNFKEEYVYRDEGITLMSFIIGGTENKENATFEFVLKYHPLDILPYDVKADCIKCVGTLTQLEDTMNDLALEMKTKPFWDVFLAKLEDHSQFNIPLLNNGSSSDSNISVHFNID